MELKEIIFHDARRCNCIARRNMIGGVLQSRLSLTKHPEALSNDFFVKETDRGRQSKKSD